MNFGVNQSGPDCFDQAEHMDAMCGAGWSETEGAHRYEVRSPLPAMRSADLTRGLALAAFMDALIADAFMTKLVWVNGIAHPRQPALAQAAE